MKGSSRDPAPVTPPASSVRHAEPIFIPELFVAPDIALQAPDSARGGVGKQDFPGRAQEKSVAPRKPSPQCIGKFVRIFGEINEIDALTRRVTISFRGCALAVDVTLLPLGEPLRVGRTMEFFGEICRDLGFEPALRHDASYDPSSTDCSDTASNNISLSREHKAPSDGRPPRTAAAADEAPALGSGGIVLKARVCRGVEGVDLLLYERTVRITRAFMNDVTRAEGLT